MRVKKMCTTFSIQTKDGNNFVGRNLDLAYNVNECPLILPRNYLMEDKVTGNMQTTDKALIGIGTVIDDHPSLVDAMNENGLVCAGLNFEGFAHFEEKPVPEKTNITPYDFIYWVVSNYDTVDEVKTALSNIDLVDVPLNDQTPVPTLHWMITDKTGSSIVVEKTKEQLAVYDNPVGVMTNQPTFDWHLMNLNRYISINPNQPEPVKWSDQLLQIHGVGAGTLGLPGDSHSVSRFVRIAYARAHMPVLEDDISAVTQCMHMLDYVKMVKAGVLTEGMAEKTTYSACMDQENGIYYYKNYGNSRINAVNMHKEDLDGDEIIKCPYLTTQDINYQN